MNINTRQRGAVSLFIVLFTALLITVLTISFVRLMVRDQQQASTADLSQSAYDSALAGVEDAKRALLQYQAICADGASAACDSARARIGSDACNESLAGIIAVTGDEIKIQQQTGDGALDQAYTCVKVNLVTDDYVGVLEANNSKVVPLVATGDFNKVKIEWFDSRDLPAASGSLDVNLQPEQPLLTQSLWQPNRPSLMRTQLMQFGQTFKLTDFEGENASGEMNASTLFLYPTGITGQKDTATPAAIDRYAFDVRDVRKTATGSLDPVKCRGDLTNGGYACSVELTLPNQINAGTRTAFLRLSALYTKTNYSVTLFNGVEAVSFNGIQPKVDSTGRANDLFRRVQSRVELSDTNFAYPEATIDISGNFCKNFSVTDTAELYDNCTP